MREFLSVVLVICLCMLTGSVLYSEDITEELPEDGMYPDYTPENVTVPEERLIEDTVPVNEPEIEEKDRLENDESDEDRDYNAFEGEINEIQADQKAITED